MTIDEIDGLLNLKEQIIALDIRINYLKNADEIEMKLWKSQSTDGYLTTFDMSLNEIDAIIQRNELLLKSLNKKLSQYELRETTS